MKPYDKLTIIRNRHRARDLRLFRELVETYFERAEYDEDDLLMDWEGAREARAQINQMLPRVSQIVHAAGLGKVVSGAHHGPPAAAGGVEIIHKIFSSRYADGACQEILDVIDMALGVYEASRFNALARTFNPFHYVLTALAFVGDIPRRTFQSMGLWPRSSRGPKLQADDLTRLNAAVSHLTSLEDVIERQFAEMREWQARQFGENNGQLTELAERLDFAERVLAQQPPAKRLKSPEGQGVSTPV